MRPALPWLLFLLLSFSGATHAVAKQPPNVARIGAGPSTPGLLVGFDGDVLRASVCTKEPCTLAQGTPLGLPPEFVQHRARAELKVVSIAESQRVIWVTVPSSQKMRAWEAIVAAVPGRAEPMVVFSGLTGYVSGEDGLRRGTMIQVSDKAEGGRVRRLMIGDIVEDLELCGRPAVLSPKILMPDSLALKPAKVQRLTASERAAAVKLLARRVLDPTTGQPPNPPLPVSGSQLLRVVGASSAVGSPSALVDGDPETTWAENRGGTGRGEYVVMRAPSDVPLLGFEFKIRPTTGASERGTGPREVWLVTRDRVYAVEFADDTWQSPGSLYRVDLPASVTTDCLALVTETAVRDVPDVEVTFAELGVRTEFSSATIETLVGALAGGEARAEAAGSVLSTMGVPAIDAVARVFPSLDEDGRRVALGVADHAPCEQAAPIYVEALLAPHQAQVVHATTRLEACGARATPALLAGLGRTASQPVAVLDELAVTLAPSQTLPLMVRRLANASADRESTRQLLARALARKESLLTTRQLLSDVTLDRGQKLRVLRLLDERIRVHADLALPLLLGALDTGSDWRERFLAVGPAARLEAEHQAIRARLTALLTQDDVKEVRAEIARSLTEPTRFVEALRGALADPEVRVREAAVQSLAKPSGTGLFPELRGLFERDPWPLVRAAVLRSLAAQGREAPGLKLFTVGVEDPSFVVRAAAVDAIAERGLLSAGEAVLERLRDDKERIEVRTRAARALGELCDSRALEELTAYAARLSDPMLDPNLRSLGFSALSALGRLHPDDLAERLRPLGVEGRNGQAVRDAKQAALERRPACPRQ